MILKLYFYWSRLVTHFEAFRFLRQTASSLQIRYNTLQHGSGGTLVSVSSLVRHGSYNPSTIDHDIGLLRLSADLSLGGTQARAVSLPAQGSDPSSGTSVLIAGLQIKSISI